MKVSDFGLAKFLEEGTGAAIHQASVGLTLAYAAPELFDNRVVALDRSICVGADVLSIADRQFPIPERIRSAADDAGAH